MRSPRTSRRAAPRPGRPPSRIVVLEARRAAPDVAHDVRVAAADAAVAVARRPSRARALVLARRGCRRSASRRSRTPATGPARLVVRAEPDVRPARMARHRDRAAALALAQHRARAADRCARSRRPRACRRSRRRPARGRSRSRPRSPSGSGGRTRPRARGSRDSRVELAVLGQHEAVERELRACGSTGSSSRPGRAVVGARSSGCADRGSCRPEDRAPASSSASRANSTAHGHADAHRAGRAADDVREQPRPLLELDVGEHVGQRVAERRRLVLVRSR